MRARKVARRSGEALLLVVAGLAAAVTGIVLGEVVVTGEIPSVDAMIGLTPATIAVGPVASQPEQGSTSTTQNEPQRAAARTATSVAPPTTAATPDSGLVSTTDVEVSTTDVEVTTTDVQVTTTVASEVTVTLEGNSIPGNGEWDAAVTVAVAGPGGEPVPGATVTAVWAGTVPIGVSEPSGPDGLAEFRLAGIEGAWVSFTVIDVLAEGLEFDAGGSITSLVVSGQ